MAGKSTLILLAVAVGLGSLIVAGCESDAQTGALIGGAAGAGIGQLAGRDTKSTLIGAGVGAGAGYIVGNESDKNKTKAEIEGLRQQTNEVTVNMTNSNGSVSTVKLRRQGVGYVGPRGEYYSTLPTEAQLKPIYGF
jgi:hypothetical protein